MAHAKGDDVAVTAQFVADLFDVAGDGLAIELSRAGEDGLSGAQLQALLGSELRPAVLLYAIADGDPYLLRKGLAARRGRDGAR